MNTEEAFSYIKTKTEKFQIAFSCYTKKIWIHSQKLLDAVVHKSKSMLGLVCAPNPCKAIKFITSVTWTEQDACLFTSEWENVGLLLHQPSLAQIKKGVIILEQKQMPEATLRLFMPYLKNLCNQTHEALSNNTEWPSRQLENLVKAKFKRARVSLKTLKARNASLHPGSLKVTISFKLQTSVSTSRGFKLYINGIS